MGQVFRPGWRVIHQLAHESLSGPLGFHERQEAERSLVEYPDSTCGDCVGWDERVEQ